MVCWKPTEKTYKYSHRAEKSDEEAIQMKGKKIFAE